jgi:hypothetical protein
MLNVIIVLLLCVNIYLQYSYSVDNQLLRIRNQYLRLYVLHKKDKIKSCIWVATDAVKERTSTAYNSMLSKYYDTHILYYSLSPDERELIDQLINMHF